MICGQALGGAVVAIEFNADPEEVARIARDAPWRGMSELTLLDAAFDFPVRITADGVDLLRSWRSPWVATPLIHLAVLGLAAVRSLKPGTSAAYQAPEQDWELSLRRTGDAVTLRSSATSRPVMVSYAELLGEWTRFHRAVGQFLYGHFSELRTHPRLAPHMGGYFPGL